ncbi:MAG: DUF3592 domain-containing protein [Candidatus Saccharimonadales bacterium]
MKLFSTLKNQATGFLDQYKQRDPASYAAAQQAVGGLLILDGFVGIDNPFAGKKRSGIFGTLIMVIMGIIFMLLPTFIGNMTGMNKMTAQTTGQVVSVGEPRTSTDSDGNKTTTCNFTAKYSVNGKQYQSASSSSSSSACQMTAGQSVNIDYNPDNPSQWMNDRKIWSMILNIFFFIGIFILLTGIVTFVIRLISIIFGWKILQSGRALAKTLPGGADLGATINTMKNDFKKMVFGNNSGGSLANVVQNSLTAVSEPQATAQSAQQQLPGDQQAQSPTYPPIPPANQFFLIQKNDQRTLSRWSFDVAGEHVMTAKK